MPKPIVYFLCTGNSCRSQMAEGYGRKYLGERSRDRCPMTPSHVKRYHWGVDDPAKAEGSGEEKRAVFQRVRDEIEARIKKNSPLMKAQPR